MGSLQGVLDRRVDVRSANIQTFGTVSFPTQNALFPNWWMNEGGQSATGEVRFGSLSAHIVAHIRASGSAS